MNEARPLEIPAYVPSARRVVAEAIAAAIVFNLIAIWSFVGSVAP